MNFPHNCGKKMWLRPVPSCSAEAWAWHKRASSRAARLARPRVKNPAMDSQMNNMRAAGQPSPIDKMFVKKAMQGGMAEVQLGQLTLQKTSNDQVKQFAQRMIDDHTKLKNR